MLYIAITALKDMQLLLHTEWNS